MCGIAGKLNWHVSPSLDTVQKMCDKMAHRGPDDSLAVSLGNIVLGHRRLSIIDLSVKARQPMVSNDKRYYIVYNGEVYNFKDIKKELQGLGYIFNSNSDTEVVLYAYIEWREKCLNKFNGMFAFAVWDVHLKELFLARDRFGKKPLYYYFDPRNGIVFASELTALISDKEVPVELSYEALNCYLAIGYILSPMTVYKDVFKLRAASYALISCLNKNIKTMLYWDYAERFMSKTKESERDIAQNIKSLLEESVKKRMVSDVSLGAFLSGGVDSSSVVSIMKGSQPRSTPPLDAELHTFSMGFDEDSYNELPDADRAAKWINTSHHNKICKITGNFPLVDEAINAYDEPFADNSLIPTFEVSKLASNYVKVVLSGDGADEIFAGYITYKADKYYLFAKAIPRSFKKALINLSKRKIKAQEKIDWRYKSKQFLYGSMYSKEEAHYLWRIHFHSEERVNILGESYRELVYDTDPFLIFKRYYDNVRDIHWLDRNLYVDGMTWLTDDILVKVDRASMRNSIEVRCPYLDIDLVSYAASIPPQLKMKGLKTKYILKKALKGVIPEFILKKSKSGFNAPIGTLIKNDGDEFKGFNKYVFDKKAAQWDK